MTRLCAWCGRRIRGRGREVSHSICDRCYAAAFQCQFAFLEEVAAAPAPTRLQPAEVRAGHSAGKSRSQTDFTFALAEVSS